MVLPVTFLDSGFGEWFCWCCFCMIEPDYASVGYSSTPLASVAGMSVALCAPIRTMILPVRLCTSVSYHDSDGYTPCLWYISWSWPHTLYFRFGLGSDTTCSISILLARFCLYCYISALHTRYISVLTPCSSGAAFHAAQVLPVELRTDGRCSSVDGKLHLFPECCRVRFCMLCFWDLTRDFADSVVGMICQSVSGSINRYVNLCYVLNFV